MTFRCGYLAVDEDGDEGIYRILPTRTTSVQDFEGDTWKYGIWDSYDYVPLPKGMIKRMIGKELTWEDEPYPLDDDTRY